MKEDKIYIEHILSCIKKIKSYTKNLDKEEFKENEMIVDAVIRNFEIIGEASKLVSENLKESYIEIPWRLMAGMRDKLIHDYLGVDTDVIWETIHSDIPQLEEQLKEMEL